MTTRSATIAAQGSLERSEDASPAPHSGAGFVRVGVKATRPRGQSERDNTKRPSRREQRAKTRSEARTNAPQRLTKKRKKSPPQLVFQLRGLVAFSGGPVETFQPGGSPPSPGHHSPIAILIILYSNHYNHSPGSPSVLEKFGRQPKMQRHLCANRLFF